ncbi:MAG: hypothetical protein PHN45_07290, partial [Methylococcales bacterium]|nr:hypothetical protein [Methylococcales bacterium]
MGEANRRGTFAERKKFREEARAVRYWRLNNPTPKQLTPLTPFFPLTEPFLPLTDELYAQLVASVKFKNMSKSNFDYLRSQNILYDTRNHTFFSSQKSISELKGEALVKTCEISSQNKVENTQVIDFKEEKTKAFLYKNSVGQATQKLSDMSDYAFDKYFGFEPKAKKEPDNSSRKAVNFSILSVLRKTEKKVPRCEDLKLLDFDGTDFKVVRAYDDLTGQIFYYSVKGRGKDTKFIPKKLPADVLVDRFSLQKVMAVLLPKFRVSKCLNVVQTNSLGIRVFKSVEHGTISLSNLQTCGSVWHCPICAAKITERRRVEMNQAIISHIEAGGSVSFVTRTTPHYKTDSLFKIRTKFSKADGYLKNHRSYRKVMKLHGVSLGSIKAKELTVSDANGWHLHVHEVYFHDAGAFKGAAVSTNPEYVAFLETFRAGLYKRWKAAAVKAGFEEPSEEHGLQVQNGDFAADYVAKWGVEPTQSNWDASSELTKAHLKNSKKGY